MSSTFEKIRKKRQEKGYSQEFMADKMGFSQTAYSKIEAGETKLTWERIGEISKLL